MFLYAPHRHRRLVEPFVGSMAVALGLQPAHALLCDVNVHLINFHRRLRDDRPFALEMRNTEECYYAYRKCFNEFTKTDAKHTRTAAELFYYLNRTGFNGLCRFNKVGELNVAYGKYATLNYRRDFSEYAAALRHWGMCCVSFEKVLVSDEDFIYLDPPYDDTFTGYSGEGFTWEQQVDLARRFGDHAGPVVASNQATDRVLTLYQDLGYTVEIISAPRTISCDGNRTPAKEMLATKNV